MSKTIEFVALTGNTYPVKDQLKALGARWMPEDRCWMIRADRAAEAQSIIYPVASAPAPIAPRSDVSWSDEQKAIFAWFAEGVGARNLVVQARAGTGKTTTIKEAFTHAPDEGSFLYAVFNKKNQREAQEKITDSRVTVRTLHSLGFWFIKNVWRDAKPDDEVEQDRLMAIEPKLHEDIVSPVLKLVGFCKNLTTEIPSLNTVLDIADARNITVPDGMEQDYPAAAIAQLAIDVLKQSLVQDDQDRVSFNDMVWLPVAAGWVKPTFSLVVVDEAQDMNMPQLLMATKACTVGGRVCIVGDDRQAIYGFRGAATDGMSLMRERLHAKQLGLTVTYRCPRLVVEIAQQIVSDYSAAPSAPEGQIIDLTIEEAMNTLVPGDAVLSRLNAPLMGIALGLLRKGVSARIEGRDIGKQLVGMVRKLKAKSVPDFFSKLTIWGEKQSARIQAAGGKHKASKLELIQDQVATLSAVAQDCKSVTDIEQKITSLFEDSAFARKEAVVCSSVHKAKGLEWNRVCLIESSFRSKGGQGATGEESNVYYVACTRAKRSLIRAT